MSKENLAMWIPASLSIFGSGIVILTYCAFKRLRQLKYVELVFYVAINDFLASIEIFFGSPKSGSIACWIQGIGTGINFLSSMFWSTVIAYQVYLIIYTGKGIERMALCHGICWFLPIILTLIPLTTNTYGESDDGFWCFISDRQGSPSWGVSVWIIFGYFFWLWICILIIILLFILIVFRVRNVQSFYTMNASRYVQLLVWYPITLVICWLIPTIVVVDNFLLHHGTSETTILELLALATPASQGFLLSVAFFYINSPARKEWLTLCTGNVKELDQTYSLFDDEKHQRNHSVATLNPVASGTTTSHNKSSVFTMSEGLAEIWTSTDSSGTASKLLRSTLLTNSTIYDDV